MNKTASLCIIGSELTKGIIGDSHSKMICQELNNLNIDVNQISIINDDGTIEIVLESYIGRNDFVFVTGGLGPTSDDMTRDAVARVAGVDLVQNEEAYQYLYNMIGDYICGANYSQTQIPEGFSLLFNPNGTAPGFYGTITKDSNSTMVFSMPGPPRELKPMFYNLVLPIIKENIGIIDEVNNEYSTFMIGESKLEELLTSLNLNDVKWGTRFQENKISLFLSGLNCDGTIELLREKAGKELFLDGNHEAIDLLIDGLISNNLTISCAESCTGGLCSKLLTDKSGSSEYFEGGVVSYSNRVKNEVLNVNKETLEKYGAVSKETVIEMAENVRAKLNTDVSFSISGIAGPLGGTDEKPIGTVWFGFSKKDAPTQAVCLNITTISRAGVRKRAAVAAFILTSLYIKGYCLLDIIDKWAYI